MKFNVFLPLIFSVAMLVIIIAVLTTPQLLIYFVVILLLLSFFISWSFAKEAKHMQGLWQFTILPIVTNLITVGYLMIQSDKLIIYVLCAFLLVFNYIYWRYLYFYLNNPSRYQSFSLEYLSFYINFALAFFLSTSVFGLRSFLDLSLSWSLLIMSVCLLLILYQFNWICKYQKKISLVYMLVLWAVLIEFFIVLLYLPLNHNTLGFIWSVGYYLLSVVVNDKLKDKLNSSRLRIYILVSVLCVLVTMISARWH